MKEPYTSINSGSKVLIKVKLKENYTYTITLSIWPEYILLRSSKSVISVSIGLYTYLLPRLSAQSLIRVASMYTWT